MSVEIGLWYCNVCAVSGVQIPIHPDEPLEMIIHQANARHRAKSPACPAIVRFLWPDNWYAILLHRSSTGDPSQVIREVPEPNLLGELQ